MVKHPNLSSNMICSWSIIFSFLSFLMSPLFLRCCFEVIFFAFLIVKRLPTIATESKAPMTMKKMPLVLVPCDWEERTASIDAEDEIKIWALSVSISAPAIVSYYYSSIGVTAWSSVERNTSLSVGALKRAMFSSSSLTSSIYEKVSWLSEANIILPHKFLSMTVTVALSL